MGDNPRYQERVDCAIRVADAAVEVRRLWELGGEADGTRVRYTPSSPRAALWTAYEEACEILDAAMFDYNLLVMHGEAKGEQ